MKISYKTFHKIPDSQINNLYVLELLECLEYLWTIGITYKQYGTFQIKSHPCRLLLTADWRADGIVLNYSIKECQITSLWRQSRKQQVANYFYIAISALEFSECLENLLIISYGQCIWEVLNYKFGFDKTINKAYMCSLCELYFHYNEHFYLCKNVPNTSSSSLHHCILGTRNKATFVII